MNRTIKPSEAKSMTQALIIDVRRKADYDSDPHKIPGATWKDPEQVAQWSNELPKDKDIVIYCVRGGSVSNSVVDQLQGKNLKARFIEGGIEAWKKEGGPTVSK